MVPAWRKTSCTVVLAAVWLAACSSPTAPSPGAADFVIDVAGERFVLRTTDPETIARAEANLRGLNGMFPAGPVRSGNGGFNAPWTWHLDPADTRFVEAAIEVCDGRPSYLEQHQSEFPSYCPWGARVVERRTPAAQ